LKWNNRNSRKEAGAVEKKRKQFWKKSKNISKNDFFRAEKRPKLVRYLKKNFEFVEVKA